MATHHTHPAITRRPLAQASLLARTIFVTGATSLLAGCGRDAAANTIPASAESRVPVRVTSLTGGDDAGRGRIEVTGTLAGKEEVALAFKIGGVISRITVNAGEPVRAGQVLAELRPTEIAAQVATAREAQAKAERDLTRVQTLYTDSVATLEQLQDARTGREVAANALRAAQFNAEYAAIRAPGAGVVLSRTAEPGQVIEPGRSVLVVRRSGRGMVVRIGLPDRDAVRIHLGDPATVTFDAMPGRHYAARVTQRAAIASAGAGDYGVEVTLEEGTTALPTGLVARVALAPAAAPSRTAAHVLVPIAALVDADADSAAVFVLGADRATVTRRAVRLADVTEALHDAMVPVISGLDGRETVVTAGVTRLVDGAKVTVVTTATQRATTDAAPAWKAAP